MDGEGQLLSRLWGEFIATYESGVRGNKQIRDDTFSTFERQFISFYTEVVEVIEKRADDVDTSRESDSYTPNNRINPLDHITYSGTLLRGYSVDSMHAYRVLRCRPCY